MSPDLSERDRERFNQLRARLRGVAPADDRIQPDPPSQGPIDPMLATGFTGDLDDVEEDQFSAERKFDGTRLILEKFDGTVSLYTRRHVERSGTLSALATEGIDTLPDGLILDGEYTYLTSDGRSHFEPIHSGSDKIAAKNLTARFFVFDLLAVDGEWCTRSPLEDRRVRLHEVVPEGGLLALTEVRTSGFQEFFSDMVEDGEEGIMLKRRSSPYHIGTRSTHWQKVKGGTDADVLAVGYTPGEGQRSESFGALVMTDGESYLGRVGSGFSESELTGLRSMMTPITNRPVPIQTVGMPYTPVEPFVIQVTYQAITENGNLRAPVFLRTRPDKPVEDVFPLTKLFG